MLWEHKGIPFEIEIEELGPFFMASARVPEQGRVIRVRSFAALGKSEEESIGMLQDQIRMKYRRVPEVSSMGQE